MKILLTGATGFLGRRLLRELLGAGHRVVCAGRRRPPVEHGRCSWLKLEFTATPADVWAAHLDDVDAVVNLVGVFRERGAASFTAVHLRGPQALFDACVQAGVTRVVQISALGAEARLVVDAAPEYVIPARITYVASVAQFTPKTVETTSEREKMMFRVKARIDPDLLRKHLAHVKTGVPGMAYLRLDPAAEWPAHLAIKVPQ